MKLSLLIVIAAVLLLNACAPITRVILLPQADGSASSVVVKSSKGEQILSTPYQRASGQEDAPVKLDATTSAEVQKAYPALFAN
jgi:OOP family OmpA-OmpF porin